MLDDILHRIECGTTTVADAEELRAVVDKLADRAHYHRGLAGVGPSDGHIFDQREYACFLGFDDAIIILDFAGGRLDVPGLSSGPEHRVHP